MEYLEAQAERIAYGMKGACANFGVAPLADIFSEIETHGRNGQPEAALEAHARAAHRYTAGEIALRMVLVWSLPIHRIPPVD